MPISNDVIKIIRLYVQNVPKSTVSTRLRTLWNMLSDAEQTQVGDVIESYLYDLLVGATNNQLRQIGDILTRQQKTLIFNAIKDDLINSLSTANDEDINFVTNVTEIETN